ncbi:energy-coupling factor transporter transmembrane component T family protein [Pararhizobium antarcticum]|uniref:Transporter n=1 Tax=Pararhizobium antarcticum TaxID=1798805 RepID=A0A657LVX2_9HYPH|nr:energy-coupling factor transporter transmembrane protein EcfT [Pararhizobium antarcticum]OJF97534.1 transporter [Rhizobium sp. 58]OJF98794.1 transporter [Pararhizobium antarcticum]OJF98819.1 transporter [Pararhizobium antarcticum]
MKTLYVDGNTALHRLSPRVKLAGLMLASILLFLTRSPLALGTALALAIYLYAMLPLGFKVSLHRLRPVLWTIAVVALFSFLVQSAEEATVALLRLSVLMLLAASVTATTTVSAFIEVATEAARPLERMGLVNAADIGLAIGLVIRFVPDITGHYQSVRDAHLARGIKLRPLTVVVPLIILTLKSADEVAGAIDARGIRNQKA